MVKPAFDSEYFFQIIRKDRKSYEINSLIFDQNIWYAKDIDSVKASCFRRAVNNELAQNLDTLFKMFMRTTSNITGGGEDGISYMFICKDNKKKLCGETWSPGNNTLVGQLTQICDSLWLYGKGEKIDQIQLLEKTIELKSIMSTLKSYRENSVE